MPAANASALASATDSETAPALNAENASRSLRRGLVSLAILVALAGGLILAVPGLHGVAHTLAHMQLGWIAAAIALEILSCLGYVLAFLQVFETAPLRFGGRVALTELAFGTAVSLGGAGSVAVGAWLLIERGAPPARVAERSVVLFLVTSAVNVITMTVVGLALFLGILPGPDNPLLSAVPAAVGIAVLAFFFALPRLSEIAGARRAPGRIQRLLETTAESVRDTRDLLLKPRLGRRPAHQLAVEVDGGVDIGHARSTQRGVPGAYLDMRVSPLGWVCGGLVWSVRAVQRRLRFAKRGLRDGLGELVVAD